MKTREMVTAKEAAARLGITARCVQKNLKARRIVGSREIGIGVRVAIESGRFGFRLVPRR